jgi:hypothetical protein
LEKKNVFPKKYVELRTFDGTSVTNIGKYPEISREEAGAKNHLKLRTLGKISFIAY